MAGAPRIVSVPERQPSTGWRQIVDDETWLGRLMLAPAILYITLLIGAPFILALYYSLSDITVGSETMHFVGLQHFQEVVQTPKFLQALRNTLLFAFVSQLLVLVLANILAQVLRHEFRGKWMVERLIGAAVAWPPLINHAARVLSRRKDMADLLVGVAGDFVPPAEVLRPAYLLRLLVPPFSRA